MAAPLNLLIVEANPSDAELFLLELQHAGFDVNWARVNDAQAYGQHLNIALDLILTDYALPQFGALQALQILQEQALAIPLIVITSSGSEEAAVECLKHGAADYLVKDRLARLGDAVRQALQQKHLADEKRRAEAALRESEAGFRDLFENNPYPMWVYDQETLAFIDVNEAAIAHYGYSRQEFLAMKVTDMRPPEDAADFRAFLSRERPQLQVSRHWRHCLKDGRLIDVEVTSHVLDFSGRRAALVIAQDVTERKRAEDALAEERNLLRTVIDNLPDLIFVKDMQGRFVLSNIAHAQAAQKETAEELIGKFAHEIFAPALAAQYDVDDQRVITSGQPLINVERVSTDMAGNKRPVLTTKVPLRDRAGQVIGLVGISRDITGPKRAEEALRRSEEQYRAIVEDQTELICRTLPDGTLSFVNEAYCRYFGKTRDELLGRNFMEWVFDEDRAGVECQRSLLTPQKPVVNIEHRVQISDGMIRWQQWTNRAIFDEQAHIREFQSVGRDITDRKHAESALRQSEAAEREQRLLAEALRDIAAALTSSLNPDVVMGRILDNVGRVVPHDSAQIMLIEGDHGRVAYWRGYPAEFDTNFRSTRFPLSQFLTFQHMLRTGEPILITDTNRDALWTRIPEAVEVQSYTGAPIRVHNQVIGFIGLDSRTCGYFTQADVERLQVFADQAAVAIENAQLYDQLRQYAAGLEQRVRERTAELRHVKERAEAILNNNSDSILVIHREGTIEQTNPAFDKLFGYGTDDTVGLPLMKLIAPDYHQSVSDTLRAVIEGRQARRLEVVAHRRDRTGFDADMALSSISGQDGHVAEIVCSLRDITARKQMEAELRAALEQEKELSELRSRFISMASHEFRTPLTTILSSVGLLEIGMNRLGAEQKMKHLTKIQSAVGHMTQLLDDVLLVGKAEAGRIEFNPMRLNLHDFCQDITEEIGVSIGKAHQIAFVWQGGSPMVVLDEKLLRQIVTNLLSNAVKYSPEGSAIQLLRRLRVSRSRFVSRMQVSASRKKIRSSFLSRFIVPVMSATLPAPAWG